jgi:hypothetical protein
MFRLLDDVVMFLGFEMGYLPDRLAKVLGIILFHGFMFGITGGLWAFWLMYKWVRFRRMNGRGNDWFR